MAAIQVSLLDALSPEPAKVRSLERSPLTEADRGSFSFFSPCEDLEPLKVPSPSAAEMPPLPNHADILPGILHAFSELSASSPPRARAARGAAVVPRKVALPSEALASPSQRPTWSGGLEGFDGDDHSSLGLSPRLLPSPLVQPVQLLSESSALNWEADAPETVMHIGLASPCRPCSRIVGPSPVEAQKASFSLFDAETATGAPTPCSSPDCVSASGSPSCSDQEILRAPVMDLPSVGSALHNDGMCNPCAWFWKSVGCQSGVHCGFCHLCPDGVLKERKKAKQAMKRTGNITLKAHAHAQQPKTALSLACLV